MIIDLVNNQPEAVRYSVISEQTGECLDESLLIFYADDEKGIVRHFLLDEDGNFYIRDGESEFAWQEIKRVIKIRPKPQEEPY